MGINKDYENVNKIEKGMYIFMYLRNKKQYYRITRVYKQKKFIYNHLGTFDCVPLKLELDRTEILPSNINKEYYYKSTFKLVESGYCFWFKLLPLDFICETDEKIFEIFRE